VKRPNLQSGGYDGPGSVAGPGGESTNDRQAAGAAGLLGRPAGLVKAAYGRWARREQWLVLALLVLVPLMLMDRLWNSPVQQQIKRLQAEMTTRQEALNRTAEDASSPERQRLRAEEAELRGRIYRAQSLSRQMSQQAAGLPSLLRTMTADLGSLQLTGLELAPDPQGSASLPGARGAAGAPASQGGRRTGLHHLPLNLTVRGPYGELQRLLTRVELEAPSLQWVSLSLESAAWPEIRLSLKAQVPSHTPNWGAGS
jgi:hypothetical protein